jgi:4-diphosphocytidyl-2-C-methyl-D-erythritol kinase
MIESTAPRVRVRALAKINLTLRVLGLRADGYHELRTTFQSLALHDTLTFTAVDGPFAIECDDPSVPTDRSNLVWRAAEALCKAAGRRGRLSGVRVRLQKRIPAQAGLGGGSSDAAATLRALGQLWRCDLPVAKLHAVARDLGADVAYFMSGGAALGIDRGDRLFALADRPPQPVVVVRPSFGVSTADAYRWWDAEGDDGARPGRGVPDDRFLPSSELRNDLEPPVARRHPEIARLGAALRRNGAVYAAMSGSGSAVFGLFDSGRAADAAAKALAHPKRTIITTATVDRRRYERLSTAR